MEKAYPIQPIESVPFHSPEKSISAIAHDLANYAPVDGAGDDAVVASSRTHATVPQTRSSARQSIVSP